MNTQENYDFTVTILKRTISNLSNFRKEDLTYSYVELDPLVEEYRVARIEYRNAEEQLEEYNAKRKLITLRHKITKEESQWSIEQVVRYVNKMRSETSYFTKSDWQVGIKNTDFQVVESREYMVSELRKHNNGLYNCAMITEKTRDASNDVSNVTDSELLKFYNDIFIN